MQLHLSGYSRQLEVSKHQACRYRDSNKGRKFHKPTHHCKQIPLRDVTCSERPHSHRPGRPNSHKLGLLDDMCKLHGDDYIRRVDRLALARIGNCFDRKYRPGWRPCMNLCATVDTRLIMTSWHRDKVLRLG